MSFLNFSKMLRGNALFGLPINGNGLCFPERVLALKTSLFGTIQCFTPSDYLYIDAVIIKKKHLLACNE